MKRHIPALLAIALSALPARGQKPILPDYHADPSVHEWDGRFWIYPSHDLPGSTFWDMVDWHVFSSNDLAQWTDHGVIFGLDDITWADRWAWAADAMKRNGRYYFYFTADDQIGVAVSDSPAGPFIDALGEPLIRRGEAGTRVMDPAIFVDDDGQAYLYFGQDAPRVVKLRDDMVTRDGPVVPLELDNFHEGIWVHERDGLYYVSYATWNHEADMASTLEYAVGTSPLGPFEHRGVILDNKSRNVHHSIAELAGRWYLFYHVQGPTPYERRVAAEFLEYEPDGSIRPVEMTLDGIAPGQAPWWEDQTVFEVGQLPGHAPLFPYDDAASARSHERSASPYVRLLNGTWKFHWARVPEQAPPEFYRDDYDVGGWADITVPGNWQTQGFGHPIFRNVNQPFPSTPPRVPDDYNPVGSYRRTFRVPEGWAGRRVHLRFEGVKSASYVWVNGRQVGYNQGGMEPAEYDITDYLRPGENGIAVRVLRYSDGTYLENQDMWRLAGIFRDVLLVARAAVHVRDVYFRTDLDEEYRNATLEIDLSVRNDEDTPRSGWRVRASLLDPSGTALPESPVLSDAFSVDAGGEAGLTLRREIEAPLKWSAETPHLYTAVLELLDDRDRVREMVSERFGFREVEVVGQAIRVNGVSVKFNGVNRHEHHPVLGRTQTREVMEQDLRLMKRFNINLVRTSHYPPDPLFLDLADEYGMYVVDETGDETHSDTLLSHDITWRPMFVDRVRKMVLRDRNHPSIVFWSAGNEAGAGLNIGAVIEEGKRLDPSRPIWMYGGNEGRLPYEDVIGPRYPTPEQLGAVGRETPEEEPRPSFLDEYLAATGNSLGHLSEYWDHIYRHERLTGGAIWDWVSPGLLQRHRSTPDASPTDNDGALMGGVELVAGVRGRAASLSGLDEWVELYRNPALDLRARELTLAAWVHPREWNGAGSLITKGRHQFGLWESPRDTLLFFVNGEDGGAVRAAVPGDWRSGWRHVAGVYDGEAVRLFVDGRLAGEASYSEPIRNSIFPVAIGKDADRHDQDHRGQLSNAAFDEVRIFGRALTKEEIGRLMAGTGGPSPDESLLWLDFDEVVEGEPFFSLGIGGRAYGLVWPDRRVQPELWELKKVPQPVKIEPHDLPRGEVRITNRFDFTDLDAYGGSWELQQDGEVVQRDTFTLSLPPHESAILRVPFQQPRPVAGAEYRLLVRFSLRDPTRWAEAGHELAWEQLDLPIASPGPALDLDAMPAVELSEDRDRVTIAGDGFQYTFDRRTGSLSAAVWNGTPVLSEGPLLNVFRAPTSNEYDLWGGAVMARDWLATGTDRLEHRVTGMHVVRQSPHVVRIVVDAALAAEGATARFDTRYTYYVLGSGDIVLHHRVVPGGVQSRYLPRVGLRMKLRERFRRFVWYGRGPFETYPDRKTGAPVGVHSGTVEEQYVPYLMPQEHGNRTDVRWAALTDGEGSGLLVTALDGALLNASVHEFDLDNLYRAHYPFQLVPRREISFYVDHRVTGVGGTAITTLPAYQVDADRSYEYWVRLRPLTGGVEEAVRLGRQVVPLEELKGE